MQVESAGFTLAPLQSRYMRGHEESPTCLVTFVLKVDLGGWLSDRSWARALFQPWYKLLANAFLEPLLMSVIALRDTVTLPMPSALSQPLFRSCTHLRTASPGLAKTALMHTAVMLHIKWSSQEQPTAGVLCCSGHQAKLYTSLRAHLRSDLINMFDKSQWWNGNKTIARDGA